MKLRHKVILNTAAMFGGRLFVAILGIVSLGIMSRYLGLTDFGYYATASAYVAIFIVLADWGIYTIAAREVAKDPNQANRLISNVMTMGLVFSVVVAGLAMLLMPLLYPGADVALLRTAIAVLSLQLLLVGPNSSMVAYFIAGGRPYFSTVSEVFGRLTAVGLVITAVTLDWGLVGVVAAQTVGTLIGMIILIFIASREIRPRFSIDWALWKQIATWAIPLGGAMVVNYLYFKLDIVLLSLMRPPTDVAIYGMAYKVVETLLLLPSLFMLTLFPNISSLATGNLERLRELIQKVAAAMFVMGLPITIIFIVYAQEVIQIIGGAEFAGSADVLQLLMVTVGLGFITATFGNSLIALNRQARFFKFSLAVLIINLILNVIFIPIWGVYGAATALIISDVVAVGTVIYLYAEVVKLPTLYKPLAVLLSAAIMTVVFCIKAVPAIAQLGPVAEIVIGGTLGIGAYAVALFVFKAVPRELLGELIKPLSSRLKL